MTNEKFENRLNVGNNGDAQLLDGEIFAHHVINKMLISIGIFIGICEVILLMML